MDRNKRRAERDFCSRRSFSPDWYGKYGTDFPIRRRRTRLRRSAIQEAQEVMGEGSCCDTSSPLALDDYHDDSRCKRLHLTDFLTPGSHMDVPHKISQVSESRSDQDAG